MILSVAKYYSPSGKAIQDTGVTPNVPQAEEEASNDIDDDNAPDTPEPQSAKPGVDRMLNRAFEIFVKGPAQK